MHSVSTSWLWHLLTMVISSHQGGISLHHSKSKQDSSYRSTRFGTIGTSLTCLRRAYARTATPEIPWIPRKCTFRSEKSVFAPHRGNAEDLLCHSFPSIVHFSTAMCTSMSQTYDFLVQAFRSMILPPLKLQILQEPKP